MKQAMICGIKPLEFWQMTPHEINICIEANNEIYKKEIIVAYYNAYFQKTNERINISEFLMKLGFDTTSKEMSDEELYNQGMLIFNKIANT